MTAPAIQNPGAPFGIILIDPATGLPYSAANAGTLAGTYVTATVPAGQSNDFSPSNFPSSGSTSVGRLDLDPSSGNANLTGLLAGADGQMVLLRNPDATNSLTLNNQSTSSLAANRFASGGDVVLNPGIALWIVYYGGSVNRWCVVF